ncbi:hypothetical protein CSC67_20180 [Pusillimonas caeni]|uniref:P-type ATPase n=1 Tax=Pusillimonas caeni TaxID=1348472 RepID=UPI000E599C6B|nr:hypothetical protein [Pusillimonas caeni]TFL08883.1 hypothetical protein CSC67_20180 [Pusillimonas caeni]
MRAFSIFSIPDTLAPDRRQQRRHMLARLGLAWLAMMQVMMFAFPGYLRTRPMGAEDQTFLDSAIVLMNWVSLALTVPVVLYCAWPVWQGALRRMRRASLSMDVPVALGIVAAFIPSAYATFSGRGEVYFDSVTMFVAFLLTARYLELCARQAVGSGRMHDAIERHRVVLSDKADRVAIWFTIIQLGVAFAAGAVWYLHAPERAVGIMVAMLVISCPCAMAMAVPTSIAAAHASLMARPSTTEYQLAGLTRASGRVARQSLLGAMLWHVLMMPLAALGWVQPWLAAITMLLSSLAVAANAWRLFRRQTAAAPSRVAAAAG